jgi:serine/threonine-protein kinase
MGRPAGFQIGDRVGPYELVSHVGTGGFASVWLGRRKGPGGFEVRVALKLTRTELTNDPTFENMFIDEAKVAALIDHPNVVKIFELGTEGDTLYMAMEYVRGRPLSALRHLAQRAGRRIPVEIVMRVIADTCAGLHAAHELTRDGKPLSVIHRDVSPENILVSDKGVVKLIDFGVAKANDRLATDTATGFAKGKVRYMAPEQALAKPLDRRADIWALGAVAYEALHGESPFDGPNDLARLMALVGTTPVPPLDFSVPPAYANIVHKALSRDVEARFPTAAAMKAAIESALEERGAHVTADALAAFFGDWLRPEIDAEEDADPHARIRVRRAAHVAQETTDIGLGARESPRSVETLGALNSSVALVPRSPWRVTAVAVTALVIGAFGALWMATRSPAALGPPSPAAATAEAGLVEVRAEPASELAVAPATPTPAPAHEAHPVDDLDDVVDAGREARALPASGPAPTPHVRRRPSTKKPRSAPGTARPRYDDTIQ